MSRPGKPVRRHVVAVLLTTLAVSALGTLGPAPARADTQPHDPDATRILITGDSITQGRPAGSPSGGYSWRYFLWKRFEAAGQPSTVDFVGHKTGPGQSMDPRAQDPSRYTDPDFDYDHSAVSNAELCQPTLLEGGVRIDELVRTLHPDLVVSAWGINDLRRGKSAEQLLGCYQRWLDQARSADPDVDFVIARLPWAYAAHANGLRFNALLGDWAAARTTTRSRIVLAEIAVPYGPADLFDGVHPLRSGEEKIASMMASSLAAYGLPVQTDRPILPGNVFAAVPPGAPRIRVTRERRTVTVAWSPRARSLGYVVRCRSSDGTFERRVASTVDRLRLVQARRTTCAVRAYNASGSSPRSTSAVIARWQ